MILLFDYFLLDISLEVHGKNVCASYGFIILGPGCKDKFHLTIQAKAFEKASSSSKFTVAPCTCVGNWLQLQTYMLAGKQNQFSELRRQTKQKYQHMVRVCGDFELST